MITQITLKNFQRHESLMLKLAPGITTIVGSSDSGKSAVIRAIRLLAHNTPTGDDYVKHGENGSRVTLHTDLGKISRIRGKGRNEYRVTLDGEDTQIFKAFGRDVPSDVQSVLPLTDLNFQGQHDAPFFLGLSPAEAAKRLNEIVGLDTIDEALLYLGKRLRESKAEEKFCESRIANHKESIDNHDWVVGADEAYKEIEAQKEDLEEAISSKNGLSVLVEKINLLKKEVEETDIPPVDDIESMALQLEEIYQQKKDLEKAIYHINGVNKDIVNYKRAYKHYEQKLADEMGDTCPLCGSEIEEFHA